MVAPAQAADDAVTGDSTDSPADAELESVRERLGHLLPEVQRRDVRRAPAPGLFEVQRGAAFGYVTPDGRYLIRGDLIDLLSGEVLTEARRRLARLETVRKLGERAIVFAPPSELIRQTVHVFSDVDCNYCRQLHREMPRINAQGIAVRYLFYPRFGARSEAYKHAQSVYCAPDPRLAMQQFLSGGVVKAAKSDCDNPIAEQYAAAVAMGIKGTPMTILPDGSTLYGYVTAQGLAEMLRLGDPEKSEP
ncbi:MAG: DsbC family protein [Panacagrimonas sp.]